MAQLRVSKNKPTQQDPVKKWVDDAVAFIKTQSQRAVVAGQGAINRAGEVAYDTKQAAENYFKEKTIGPYVSTYERRGFPSYMTEANPNVWERGENRRQLGGFNPKTLPKKLPNIEIYRADPTGKFGGKEGIETQPTIIGNNKGLYATGKPAELYSFTRTLALGKKYGIPQLSANQLAAMVLKEGRANYGSLNIDESKEKDRMLVHKLVSEGASFQAANFAVNVKQKMEVAKRLGISFEEAWNGTGRNFQRTSGAEYARTYPAYRKAAQHPKNKQLVAFIQSALDAEK